MRLPLRLRLTLAFTVGMAIVLVVVGALVYVRLHADLLESVDLGLRARAQALAAALAVADQQSLVDAEGHLIDPDEAFAQVLDQAGRIEDTSTGVADQPLLTAAESAAVAGSQFLTRQPSGFDDPVRLLAVPIERSEGPAIVVVGSTLGDLNDALGRLVAVLLTVGPLALALVATAGWLLAGAALRPVERMRREAAAISASEPDRRLPDPGTRDELARLAVTLNSMLDRLQESIERERRFVDDASHELRTPLATLRAEIELALARERSTPDLEAALRSAQDDVERLQLLTDDLLVLARSRGGRIPVRRVEMSLREVLTRSVASVQREAATAGVTITTSIAAPISGDAEPGPMDVGDDRVKLDADRVEQAVRNLLENAIHHTPTGGTIELSAARSEGGTVRIVVADPGPGFPPEHLTDAFDPFVRVGTAGDPGSAAMADAGSDAHQHRDPPPEAVGTGLGLAIVRAVAEAHGGSVRAENTPIGARVILELKA